jgi:hypothetical protein
MIVHDFDGLYLLRLPYQPVVIKRRVTQQLIQIILLYVIQEN